MTWEPKGNLAVISTLVIVVLVYVIFSLSQKILIYVGPGGLT